MGYRLNWKKQGLRDRYFRQSDKRNSLWGDDTLAKASIIKSSQSLEIYGKALQIKKQTSNSSSMEEGIGYPSQQEQHDPKMQKLQQKNEKEHREQDVCIIGSMKDCKQVMRLGRQFVARILRFKIAMLKKLEFSLQEKEFLTGSQTSLLTYQSSHTYPLKCKKLNCLHHILKQEVT